MSEPTHPEAEERELVLGIDHIIPPEELRRLAQRPTNELEFWVTLFALLVIVVSGYHATRWVIDMSRAHRVAAPAVTPEAGDIWGGRH